jgi:hypothetical protein
MISSKIGTCPSRTSRSAAHVLGIYTYANIENEFGKRVLQDDENSKRRVRLGKLGERGFAALAQSVETLGARDPAGALETGARLAALAAHFEQLAAIEVDAGDDAALKAELLVRRRRVQKRAGATRAAKPDRR